MYTKSTTNKEFQIFKDHHDYQSRNVDHPSYEPLRQGILILSPEEEKKRKRNEYAKEYYRKNRERLREQQRDYRRRNHAKINSKGDMVGNQKRVYEYLLDQYRRGNEAPRGTEIGRALGIKDSSVYTAIFHLTKRGYVGRGSYGRYLLLKFPDGNNINEELTINNIESIPQTIVGKGYLDDLANKISAGLISQNKELFEENQKLKETINKIKEAWIEHEKDVDAYYKKWQNSYGDLDQIIMNR